MDGQKPGAARVAVDLLPSRIPFTSVDLWVAEQHGPRIRVEVTVAGDLQGLGLPSLTAERRLTFTGLDVADGDAARLADFTDVTGLARTLATTPGRSIYFPAARDQRDMSFVDRNRYT